MINNGRHISCLGCGVCAVACPHHAIQIVRSQEGFWVPVVDEALCVDCHICDKVCAYTDDKCFLPLDRVENVGAYAVVNKDKEIRKVATSGGAGFAIATYLLQQGYSLVGVRYDNEKNIACHFVTDDLDEFKQTLNSKYIPSYTPNGFSTLMNGKKYAVFGTPCQIDSLRRWARLRKKEENFFFVDLFCHGVPSYLHWDAYLKYHLKKDERLLSPIFRDKRNGWHAYTMSLQTDKRFISVPLQKNDFFQNIFFGNYSLNRSCYSCKYRGSNSAADLRLGDLWGGKYASNEEGITGVLAMTEKGKKLITQITGTLCEVKCENMEVIMAGQLHHNLSVPESRQKLLQGFREDKSLPWLYFWYAKKMWMKNLVPYGIKRFIKKVLYKLKG